MVLHIFIIIMCFIIKVLLHFGPSMPLCRSNGENLHSKLINIKIFGCCES